MSWEKHLTFQEMLEDEEIPCPPTDYDLECLEQIMNPREENI